MTVLSTHSTSQSDLTPKILSSNSMMIFRLRCLHYHPSPLSPAPPPTFPTILQLQPLPSPLSLAPPSPFLPSFSPLSPTFPAFLQLQPLTYHPSFLPSFSPLSSPFPCHPSPLSQAPSPVILLPSLQPLPLSPFSRGGHSHRPCTSTRDRGQDS